MSYNPNIPNVANSPAVDQSSMQTNFNLLNQYFGTDHVTYTAANNQGQHLQVTLNTTISTPSPSGSTSVVYSKAVSGVPQLFFCNSAGEQQITPIGSSVPALAYGKIFYNSGWVYGSTQFGFTGTPTVQTNGFGQQYLRLQLASSATSLSQRFISCSANVQNGITNPGFFTVGANNTGNTYINVFFYNIAGTITLSQNWSASVMVV